MVHDREISRTGEALGKRVHGGVLESERAVSSVGDGVAAFGFFELGPMFGNYEHKRPEVTGFSVHGEVEALCKNIAQHGVEDGVIVNGLGGFGFDVKAVAIEPVWTPDDLAGANVVGPDDTTLQGDVSSDGASVSGLDPGGARGDFVVAGRFDGRNLEAGLGLGAGQKGGCQERC